MTSDTQPAGGACGDSAAPDDVLKMVRAGAKSVLECGHSPGALTRALRERGGHLVGIYSDLQAAANELCDSVILADLEDSKWPHDLGERKFDAIVVGDILGRLKLPELFLRRLHRFVAAGGSLIAVVPNIAHGSIRLSLLSGLFSYQASSILADGQLRFFTRSTVEDLFADSGYRLIEMQRRNAGIFDAGAMIWRESFPPEFVARLESDPDALTTHFICRAEPTTVTHDDEGEPSEDALRLTDLQFWRESARQLSVRLREREQETKSQQEAIAGYQRVLDAVLASKGWRILDAARRARIRLLTTMAAFGLGRNRIVIDESAYRLWMQNVELPRIDAARMRSVAEHFSYRPLVSIVMPVFNPPEEHLQQAIASVRNQIYESWELCICDDGSTARHVRACLEGHARRDPRIRVVFAEKNHGISTASNSALALAGGDFVGLLDHDDELAPSALFEVVQLLQQHRDAGVIYSDEDKLDRNGGRCDPFFKPDWSPEYLLSCMYTCHFSVYRKSLLEAAGGFRQGFDGSQDYDLMLRVSELTNQIHHIPRVLYHWRKSGGSTAASASSKRPSSGAGKRALEEHMQRRGISAEVIEQSPNRYRVRPALRGNPRVSIIIPTKNRVGLLRNCLASIERKTNYDNYEILVADNESDEPKSTAYLSTLKHKVISVPGPFNFSRINNVAARHATGEHLVLLNNDTRVITPDWLRAMLEWCQLPEIGIVGAKLLFPSGAIQHAGVILGLGGAASHCYHGLPRRHQGYFYSLSLNRNYSAVTAACLMIRRAVYDEVNGLDEALPVGYGDVDLCLRVRQAGYRIVYTPYAELYHYESASRVRRLDARDLGALQQRWSGMLKRDPYYNPNLSLQHNYQLDRWGKVDL